MHGKGIRGLLRDADEIAGEPVFWRVGAARIRRQIRRKRFVLATVPATTAAVVLLATSLWIVRTQRMKPVSETSRIASLEDQTRQLQTQTQSTLELVLEVLERDRQDRQLAALQAELARFPHPAKEIEQQADRSAFLLLSRADRLYKESGRTQATIEAYEHVIEYYPNSRWADEARKRLSQIRQPRINKSDRKGVLKCEFRTA